MKVAEYKSDFELTKGSPYLVLKCELWGYIVRILEQKYGIIMALHCIYK